MLKCQLKLHPLKNLPCQKQWKSLFCVLSTWWWWRWKLKKWKFQFPTMTDASARWSHLLWNFFYFMFLSSRVGEQKKTFFLRELYDGQSRAREKSRKCSIFTSPDDGMYHLKVINLKISRERRQDNRRKSQEICISFIWIQINRARSGHPLREEKNIEIGTSFKWRWRISPFRFVTVTSCPQNDTKAKRGLKFIVMSLTARANNFHHLSAERGRKREKLSSEMA